MSAKWLRFFVLACACAALLPCCLSNPATRQASGFPGWPTSFEGKPLQALPLSALEQRFADNFPGRIGRFSDGQREIILRWVTQETRKLHPAADCFRGSGYRLEQQPIFFAPSGERWGRFRATRGSEQMTVSERMTDSDGQQWTDVSSWYWAAFWGQSSGPWWAITVASRDKATESRTGPPQAARR